MNNSNEYDTIANTKSPETIKQNLNKPKFGLSGTGPIDTHSYDRTDLQFSNKFKPKPPSSINNNINYNNNRINKSLDFSRSSINNDFNRNTLQTTEKKKITPGVSLSINKSQSPAPKLSSPLTFTSTPSSNSLSNKKNNTDSLKKSLLDFEPKTKIINDNDDIKDDKIIVKKDEKIIDMKNEKIIQKKDDKSTVKASFRLSKTSSYEVSQKSPNIDPIKSLANYQTAKTPVTQSSSSIIDPNNIVIKMGNNKPQIKTSFQSTKVHTDNITTTTLAPISNYRTRRKSVKNSETIVLLDDDDEDDKVKDKVEINDTPRLTERQRKKALKDEINLPSMNYLYNELQSLYFNDKTKENSEEDEKENNVTETNQIKITITKENQIEFFKDISTNLFNDNENDNENKIENNIENVNEKENDNDNSNNSNNSNNDDSKKENDEIIIVKNQKTQIISTSIISIEEDSIISLNDSIVTTPIKNKISTTEIIQISATSPQTSPIKKDNSSVNSIISTPITNLELNNNLTQVNTFEEKIEIEKSTELIQNIPKKEKSNLKDIFSLNSSGHLPLIANFFGPYQSNSTEQNPLYFGVVTAKHIDQIASSLEEEKTDQQPTEASTSRRRTRRKREKLCPCFGCGMFIGFSKENLDNQEDNDDKLVDIEYIHLSDINEVSFTKVNESQLNSKLSKTGIIQINDNNSHPTSENYLIIIHLHPTANLIHFPVGDGCFIDPLASKSNPNRFILLLCEESIAKEFYENFHNMEQYHLQHHDSEERNETLCKMTVTEYFMPSLTAYFQFHINKMVNEGYVTLCNNENIRNYEAERIEKWKELIELKEKNEKFRNKMLRPHPSVIYSFQSVNSSHYLSPYSNFTPSYNPIFLKYPSKKKVSDVITLYYRDIVRIFTPQTYYNDNLIDLGLKLKYFNLEPEFKEKIYLFSCLFYSKLTENVKNSSLSPSGTTSIASLKHDHSYRLVSRWTKNVNLFDYKYIVVPINYANHWSIVFIANPFCVIKDSIEYLIQENNNDVEDNNQTPKKKDNPILKQPKDIYNNDKECGAFIHCDSLGLHKMNSLFTHLVHYLYREYHHKHKIIHEKYKEKKQSEKFSEEDLKRILKFNDIIPFEVFRHFFTCFTPHVPKQPNGYDCGPYSLRFFDFLKLFPLHPHKNYKTDNNTGKKNINNSENLTEEVFWGITPYFCKQKAYPIIHSKMFSSEDISSDRKQLHKTLWDLREEYIKTKEEEDEKDEGENEKKDIMKNDEISNNNDNEDIDNGESNGSNSENSSSSNSIDDEEETKQDEKLIETKQDELEVETKKEEKNVEEIKEDDIKIEEKKVEKEVVTKKVEKKIKKARNDDIEINDAKNDEINLTIDNEDNEDINEKIQEISDNESETTKSVKRRKISNKDFDENNLLKRRSTRKTKNISNNSSINDEENEKDLESKKDVKSTKKKNKNIKDVSQSKLNFPKLNKKNDTSILDNDNEKENFLPLPLPDENNNNNNEIEIKNKKKNKRKSHSDEELDNVPSSRKKIKLSN